MTDTTLTFILNGRFPVDDPSLERISDIVVDTISETFNTDVVASISNHPLVYRCGDTIATHAELDLLPVGSWIGTKMLDDFVPFAYIGAGDWHSPEGFQFEIEHLPATVLYTPNAPTETDDGQANDCTHQSATGIDGTPVRDPRKVWRCDHCGLTWTAGNASYDRPAKYETTRCAKRDPLPDHVINAVRRAYAEGSHYLSELLDTYPEER